MKVLPTAKPWALTATGLLEAAVAVLGLATLAGFAGGLAWWLDLFSHFRMQYAAGGAGLWLLLLLLKRRRPALVAAGCACVNAYLLLPFFPIGSTVAAQAGAPVYKALLCNVNTHGGDPARVATLLSEEQADLVALQEVSRDWLAALAGVLSGYPYRCVAPRDDNFGIAVYSRLPMTRQEVLTLGPAGVPSIEVELEVDGTRLYVMTTHPVPPVGGRGTSYRNRQLLKVAQRLPDARPVLLLGDLNTTPWSRALDPLTDHSSLRDSARGRGLTWTWPTFLPLLGIPLDHCFHSTSVLVLHRKTGPNIGSDHLPLIVEFTLP